MQLTSLVVCRHRHRHMSGRDPSWRRGNRSVLVNLLVASVSRVFEVLNYSYLLLFLLLFLLCFELTCCHYNLDIFTHLRDKCLRLWVDYLALMLLVELFICDWFYVD